MRARWLVTLALAAAPTVACADDGRARVVIDGPRPTELERYVRGSGWVHVCDALAVQLSQDGACPPPEQGGCEAITSSVHRTTIGGLTAAGIGAALAIAGVVMVTREGK